MKREGAIIRDKKVKADGKYRGIHSWSERTRERKKPWEKNKPKGDNIKPWTVYRARAG